MKKILFMCIGLLALASYVQAASVNQVAAVVNGKMISVFDVRAMSAVDLAKAGLSTKNTSSPKAQAILRNTLEELINELLVMDAAEKQRIHVSSAEVDEEIARIMKQSNMNKATFEKQLQKDGFTITTFQNRIKFNILRKKFMGGQVRRKIIVTPDEIRNYYENNKKQFISKKETVLAIIAYPANVNAPGYAAQLIKDPSKFETLVKQVSVGPNKANGGIMGVVDFSKMHPKLAALIQKLPVGGVTPLIRDRTQSIQFKKVRETQGGRQLTFDEAKDQIEVIIVEPRMKAHFEEYLRDLRSKAVIDIRM